MSVIPFNVPGLPEPDDLSSRFVFKPIVVDTSNPHAGPRIGHRPGARRAAEPDWHDGVMCIYPDIETVAYLFNARPGRGNDVPAMVVSSQSTDGLCTIFGFGGGYAEPPQLVVQLLPEQYLPTILGKDRGSKPIQLGQVDERVEITQTFATNSFGVVSRASNEIVMPRSGSARRGSEPIFNFYDDPGTIADVCSFYMTRALELFQDGPGGRQSQAALMGGPDSIWQLIWKPTSALCIAAFATVYVLTRTSLRVSRFRGETNYELEYNRRANWPDRPPNNE